MALVSQPLEVAAPGIRATRWTGDKLLTGLKDDYAIARTERGRSEWWGRGQVWRSTPGTIQLKQPGDLHRDLARDGEMTWVVARLPALDIAHLMRDPSALVTPQFEVNDPRARPFHRLLDAIDQQADRLTLEVLLAEAIGALATVAAGTAHTRPVRIAMAYLRAHLAEAVCLDDLAREARLDKFHLCRAFRAQVGLPPHAYLTRMRISRAKQLLREGARASDVPPLVGLYDQAQLTRHFRRIVGTTPARYATSP